ncbi:pre-rRNA-processing protein TSR2 homolog [Trifolium pratense]|uniref:pre-rRNA-processing protein TSR2 homolog n=1 Tax=Trifolium pratense TaxID=57577 RepID=UPI001E6919EC|nr:pre-rRNA-processing protein TSR2 homolog [Trifolium pratense]
MEIFQEGIALVFSRWSALRLAVENEWGGRNSHIKAQQFAADIFSWFTQSRDPLYIDDLETLLEEGALEFNLGIEDGSVEEVAEELMIMHEECLAGNFGSVERLREASHNPANFPRAEPLANGNEDDDDSDENIIEDDVSANMDVDIQQSISNLNSMNNTVNEPQPTVAGEADTDIQNSESNLNSMNNTVNEHQPNVADEADDGWTTVSRRRNNGRRIR